MFYRRKSLKRKGSTVAAAFILGIVFFIAISALLQHSSGEMKHTRAISAVKKAELLSMSGIDWAESQLRKERWYGSDFEPYKRNEGKHSTFGVKKLKPFGSEEGSVTIVCEDVANKTPGANAHGMQKIWYLHHINVFSLGEYEGQSCLIYGRYIISPEPILNSKSTDGADFVSPENGATGLLSVSVPVAKANDEEITDFIVKKIEVSESEDVDINSVVAVLISQKNPDMEIKVKPTSYGRVEEIRYREGELCKSGDNLVFLKKEISVGDAVVSPKTLKKMVRVTKIPLEIWKTLDIEDINDRFALSQYINGLSDAYLQNFIAHSSLQESLKKTGSDKFDDKLSAEEVLKLFPAHITSTTKNRAENMFLAHMIKNFTAPTGTWEQKEKALESTMLKLDHPKSTKPPVELVNWLNDLHLEHLLNTKPRRDARYYEPKMKNDEFMELLRPHLNEPSSEFIKTLSELPDASRVFNIDEGDYEESKYEENENGIEIVMPDKGVKVSVEKVTKAYTFVDPANGFAIEMNDLLAFVKKYYDDDGSMAPRENVRRNEHIDWPLPAPAPEPPAERPGGTWVWQPGTPGEPPGEPTYTHSGGGVKDIDPPTASNAGFEENLGGDPDGGSKEWKIEGAPAEGEQNGDGEKNPDGKEGPNGVAVCKCNGGNCSQCNPSEPEKIKVNMGTEWTTKPGKPGKEPSQGRYVWQENTNNGNDGSDETPGSDGSGNGNGNSSDSNGGSSGSGGSDGNVGGNPGGGSSGSSTPSRPPSRHCSGAC